MTSLKITQKQIFQEWTQTFSDFLLGKYAIVKYKGRWYYGTIQNAKYIGRTERGNIPDFEVTIRGKRNSKTMSLVEEVSRIEHLETNAIDCVKILNTK